MHACMHFNHINITKDNRRACKKYREHHKTRAPGKTPGYLGKTPDRPGAGRDPRAPDPVLNFHPVMRIKLGL